MSRACFLLNFRFVCDVMFATGTIRLLLLTEWNNQLPCHKCTIACSDYASTRG
jgi:hypothetical protein